MGYLRDKKFLIDFGKNLKRIRVEKNISQAELAYSINVEISQISRLERGQLNSGIYSVFLIAKYLKVSPKELFDF